MSGTSETPGSGAAGEFRCKCGKCLAKDGQIKCSRCNSVTDARPRLLDEARHTAFFLSALATTAQLMHSSKSPLKITIAPGLRHNGYVSYQPSEAPLRSAEDMRRQIVILLSGCAAEKALCSQTTGSSSTMERAMLLVRRMVEYGMVDGWNTDPDGAARRLVESAWAEAETFVAVNRAAIESVAAMLLFKGELTGDDVARLTAGFSAPAQE